jgi:hypothetical protein
MERKSGAVAPMTARGVWLAQAALDPDLAENMILWWIQEVRRPIRQRRIAAGRTSLPGSPHMPPDFACSIISTTRVLTPAGIAP